MLYDMDTCGHHEVSIVIRYSKALLATAVAAVSFALMGAGNLPANSSAVTIYNPGDANFTGFAIAVEPSGRAWTLDGAGRSQSQLPSALTQAFFTDLAAAGPLAQLEARPCSQTEPGIYLVWHGQHSPNLQCASDPRADRLLADATAIKRGLYVQAYRVRPVVVTRGSQGGSSYNYQPSSAAPSTYANAGGNYPSTSYASPSYGSASCTCGGYGSAITSAYSFGIGGSPFTGLPTSGLNLGFTNNFSIGTSGGLSVSASNAVFANSSVFSSTPGTTGTFSSGFNSGTFSNGNSFSGQPFTTAPGSSSISGGFSFH
jgi:hypothetical protein